MCVTLISRELWLKNMIIVLFQSCSVARLGSSLRILRYLMNLTGFNTFSLRLSAWVWDPTTRTPGGNNSSLHLRAEEDSELQVVDFSTSLNNTTKGLFLLSSKIT
jgi:hypothetical protein